MRNLNISKVAPIFVVLLLLLVACSPKTQIISKKADFLIINDADTLSFNFEENGIKQVERTKTIKDNMFLRWDYALDTKNAIFGKTTENNKPGQPYLYRYDKVSHKLKTVDKGDPSKLAYDGKYLYWTDVFTDKVVLHKYTSDLQPVLEKTYPSKDALNLTTGMVTIDDHLYILIGNVDRTTNLPTNRLWILNKNLEMLEQQDIDYTDKNRGGYLEMVNVDHTLYIVEASKGQRKDGEPGEGYTIVSYNIDTKKIGRFDLKTPYPHDIFYDKSRNILVIYHDSNYVEDAKWTFVNLKTGDQRIISLAKGMNQDASFTLHNDEYFFLFKDKLVKYDYDKDKKVEYDLTKFGIKSADVLVFEPKK